MPRPSGEAVLTDPHVPGRMEAVAAPDGADCPARGRRLRPHPRGDPGRPARAAPHDRRAASSCVTGCRWRPRPRQAARHGRRRGRGGRPRRRHRRQPALRGPGRDPRRGPRGRGGGAGRPAATLEVLEVGDRRAGHPRRRATPSGRRGRPPPSPSSARATRAARTSAASCTPSTTAPSSREALRRAARGGRRVIALSLTEVARVTGGSVVAPAGVDPAAVVVDGPVVTDSREAGPGGLFVARVGEHADGHDFVAGGGRARRRRGAGRRRPVDGVPCVVVADTQDAFAALAREVVRRLPGLAVVGITGLVGQDEHQGPPRHGARHGRADGRARSGRTTPRSACRSPSAGSPPTPASSSSRWARAASATSTYLARMAPPADRRRAQRRHRPRRRVRVPRGHRHAPSPSSSRRCRADGLAVLNADDPAVRAMAVGDDRPGRPRRRGRRRRRARHRRRRSTPGGRASSPCTPRRARRAVRARARRAPPRRQRPGGGRGRHRARHVARVGLCRTGVRACPSAGGGWRSPSAPTA